MESSESLPQAEATVTIPAGEVLFVHFGAVRVAKSFDLRITSGENGFICKGPFNVMFEAEGATKEEAISHYLFHEAEQFALNAKHLNRGVTLVGFTAHVQSKLAECLSFTSNS